LAVVKLSTIISDIAGTVGGVTFRRHGGSTVVSVKSKGASKSKLRKNKQLINLRSLVLSWSSLSKQTQDIWVSQALNYTFPDKFGVQRNLSGRQLYLKLQGNQIVINGAQVDPNNLSSQINTGVNPRVTLQFNPNNPLDLWANFEVDSFIQDTFVLIQVQLLKNLSISPTFTRRQVIATKNMTNSIDFDFISNY